MNTIVSTEKHNCTDCGTELTKENTFPSWRRDKIYMCKTCGIKKQMYYYFKKGKVLAQQRSRKFYTGTIRNGKQVQLIGRKRDYPKDGKCELCHKRKARSYHHWDDDNLQKGIWLCPVCHMLAEGVDRGLHLVYLMLKTRIEELHEKS